ncbi:MAG: hypothetical protein AAFU41_02385 [Pseudomonadota bacterium]
MAATKIATCCYCGTKAALVLRGKTSHELTCGNCGAPLRAMKVLPKSKTANHKIDRDNVRPSERRRGEQRPDYRDYKYKKRKKPKGLRRKVMSEFWDFVEDVVDEIFD